MILIERRRRSGPLNEDWADKEVSLVCSVVKLSGMVTLVED